MEWNNYKDNIKNALDLFEFDDNILKILKNSIKNDQKIFIAGNGGSAAIASHYMCDLSKGAVKDWSNNPERYRAICLSNNFTKTNTAFSILQTCLLRSSMVLCCFSSLFFLLLNHKPTPPIPLETMAPMITASVGSIIIKYCFV